MADLETQEISFQKILALCEVAERMARGVNEPGVKNKKELLEIVTPVVQRVDKAVKALTELFINHVNDDEHPDKQRSMAVDAAIKEMYDALREMKEKGAKLVEELQKEEQPHDQAENIPY